MVPTGTQVRVGLDSPKTGGESIGKTPRWDRREFKGPIHVQFMHEAGCDLASFVVSNDLHEAETLIRKVLETASADQVDRVVAGMKATANLG